MAWKLIKKCWPYRWLIAFVLAQSLLIVGAWIVLREPRRFSEQQFKEIREGMSEDEVISILGYYEGDYRPGCWQHPDWFTSPSDPVAFPHSERGISWEELRKKRVQEIQDWEKMGKPFADPPSQFKWKRWWDRKVGIDVLFDKQGQVIHVHVSSIVPPRPPSDPIRWVRWFFS